MRFLPNAFRLRDSRHCASMFAFVLFILLVANAPCLGQVLFPDLLPPDTVAVASVPDCPKACDILRAGALGAGAPTTATVSEQPFPLDASGLLSDVFSATELALLPASRASVGAEALRADAPPTLDAPILLWIGRVRDPARLRSILEDFERRATTQTDASPYPLTRTVESIGATALVLISDGQTDIGHLYNRERAVWALCNNAEALRMAARRLENASAQSAPPPPASLGPALEAWSQLKASSAGPDFDVRFLYIGSGASPAPSLLDIVGNLRPRGASAGGIRLGSKAIRLESLTLFGDGKSNPAQESYGAAAGFDALPALKYALPSAIALGGNDLLNVPLLRRMLLETVRAMDAGLPKASNSGLNPASAEARKELAALETWLNRPEQFGELGPDWFYALNDFQFLQPGVFPRIDLVGAVRTRDPEATRRRLEEFEPLLLKMVGADAQAAPEGDAAFYPNAALRPSQAEPTPAPPNPKSAVRFEEQSLALADGARATMRVLRAPGLPESIRPAWAVHDGFLFAGLSGEALARGLSRAQEQSPEVAALERLRSDLGMGRLNAYQVAHPFRAAGELVAILSVAARRLGPQLAPYAIEMAQRLEFINTAAFFRRGTPSGVLMSGYIQLRG